MALRIPGTGVCRGGSVWTGRARWRALSAMAVLTMSLAAGLAGPGKAAPPTGKVALFDGKTLSGWKKTDLSNPGEVKVEGGAIVLSTGRPMTGITTTRDDLPRSNYELTYEAMRISGDDFFAAATFPVGKAAITLVNGGWGGTVTGLSSLDGMDASENETTQSVKFTNNVWYSFRVRVTENTIRAWIDGKEVAAVNYQGREVRTRIEVRGSEPLGFASWESGGTIRNIAVRGLTPEEIKATEKKPDDN